MKIRGALVAFALLSVIFCGKSFAAEPPDPCCPIFQRCCPKTYSCCNVTFSLFGEWLFLQPNGSSIYYAVEAFPYNTGIAIPEVSPSWQVFEIDPSYHSGFEVGAKFLFPKNDMNLELNWERIHTQDSASMDVAPQPFGTGNMVGPFFDIGPNSEAYKKASGEAVFHFDAVNLIFGKMVCFVNDLSARLYAGAGFSRIHQSISSTFSNTAGTISRTVYAYSTFLGAGPEFGLDFDYRLYGGFSFTGSSSLALYMGQLKNQTTFSSLTPALATISVPQPNVQTTTVPNRTQLIPGFEEKLGFCYAVSCKRWGFALGAGYQFQVYLDAVQSVDMTAPQVIPSLTPGPTANMGVYAVGFERTLSNFILTGPYVSLNIDF